MRVSLQFRKGTCPLFSNGFANYVIQLLSTKSDWLVDLERTSGDARSTNNNLDVIYSSKLLLQGFCSSKI